MIEIYDTTLRDGTQRKDISLSCSDKLRVAQRLDELGVAFIEGGWPGSNPKDVEFFKRAAEMTWKEFPDRGFRVHLPRPRGGPEDDANIKALLDANTPVCTVFGKTWTLHVTDVLRTNLPDNLRIIEQSGAYLRSKGKRVIYDAEHFFDGYKGRFQIRHGDPVGRHPRRGGTCGFMRHEWRLAAARSIKNRQPQFAKR